MEDTKTLEEIRRKWVKRGPDGNGQQVMTIPENKLRKIDAKLRRLQKEVKRQTYSASLPAIHTKIERLLVRRDQLRATETNAGEGQGS